MSRKSENGEIYPSYDKAKPYVSVLYYLNEMKSLETGKYGPEGSKNEHIILGKTFVFAQMLCVGIENALYSILDSGHYKKPNKKNRHDYYALYMTLDKEKRSEIQRYFHILLFCDKDYEELKKENLHTVENILEIHRDTYNDWRFQLKPNSVLIINPLMYTLFALLKANDEIEDTLLLTSFFLLSGNSMIEKYGVEQESYSEFFKGKDEQSSK